MQCLAGCLHSSSDRWVTSLFVTSWYSLASSEVDVSTAGVAVTVSSARARSERTASHSTAAGAAKPLPPAGHSTKTRYGIRVI